MIHENEKKPKFLHLEDGTAFQGRSFGADTDAHGEVVFNTGMVGYPEALTDPSYRGQILVLTYPIIGNYGIPARTSDILESPFESERIQIAGLIVSEYCNTYSHPAAVESLHEWMEREGIPGIDGIDTRALTIQLREKGAMLGRIDDNQVKQTEFDDPNKRNLVAEVSCEKPIHHKNRRQQKTILLYDCGVKLNIIRSLIKRGCSVIQTPWNTVFADAAQHSPIDGVVISNGPGDPMRADSTISELKKIMSNEKCIPILGICLGNQLLSLAAGAKTYKLKYGHRSQNQPVVETGTERAFVTTQNHGYAIDKKTLSHDWEIWFTNLNDGTIEGIHHKKLPWMSVQFHPEATPGPTDTSWIFDIFLKSL